MAKKPKAKGAGKEKSKPASVVPEPKHQGIAILGSHPQTVAMAPFGDPSWLVYACSPHNYEHRDLPRLDQWFEIHVPAAHPTRAYRYQEYLKTLPKVWMRDEQAMPDHPGGQLYPEAELKEVFCHFMFTSSIAFMLAKAIVDCVEMKIPRIGIWGVMQASETEYLYQRPGIQYFIWEATQRGIAVIANEESGLFEPPKEAF